MAAILYFMDMHPTMQDGVQTSDYRCRCPAKAQLRAVVEAGVLVDAGCPVCGQQYPCEVVCQVDRGVGRVYFFPPGTVVIA